MRLTEQQIKQGILHPEQMVRDVAMRYFGESFSDDPAIMPLAIQAIEAHGWEDAFQFYHRLGDLAQTEETLVWLIDQLNRQGRPENPKDANHCHRLSSIIARADVPLLMKHEQDILGLEGLFTEYREVIADRLQLMTIDTGTLWQELEQFCEDAKDKHYSNEVSLSHAFRLGEAIARDEGATERVLSILSQKLERTDDNPMGWMQCVVACIAADMRLAPAVPLLVTKLVDDDGDVMNEQCARAFIKVGGDGTIEAIGSVYPTAPWHFKLYTSSAFWNIHCDSVVSKALEFVGPEKDGQIRENLIGAVLCNFSSEGIEPARQMALRGLRELRRILVGVATLIEMPFPELAKWKKEEKEHDELVKRRTEAMTVGAEPPKATPKPQPPSFDNMVDPAPVQPIVGNEKVGRNDPCPCKSGKKYKKCCGRNK